MSVIRPGNYWDFDGGGGGGGGDVVAGMARDESYENLFSLLDFPMEDDFAGDWDITKSQCLGPIPANVLLEPMINSVGNAPYFSPSDDDKVIVSS
ncbi:hypothetical protein M569_16108 [Genlisea aurea]|uniref:Uncharacterized protein n=1 Tax=Genlisea aurea TaxID=192259 RepID=S8BVQ9_9LAMI|nr:hypothetical protein M569_16108 [Genlisea aurea]